MAKEEHYVLPERVKKLVSLLGEPEKGELNYDGKERPLSRLGALWELKHLEETGVLRSPEKRLGVNLHIHTNESFSVFNSPTEAAWEGYAAGLEGLGINDHYTIAGHREFGEACGILSLKATFNIEAMAMSEEAKRNGERYNDPKNPGRTYLCGKGVVHDLEPGSPSGKLLAKMIAAFKRRCEKMTEKVNALLNEVDPSLNLSFQDVLKLTPRGNVTERHIAQAVTELVTRRFPKSKNRKAFLTRLIGSFAEEDLSSEYQYQDLIRNSLLKTGGPAYVEEPPEAFPSIQRIVRLFVDYGAIPTYPVLGNPVTEKEKDLGSLFDELEGYGIYAVEVIPKRNTRKRLKQILTVAAKHGFPVFNGTEHNTKTPEPLLDRFSRDPAFLPVFERGAFLVLGHQFLSRYAGKGYLTRFGELAIKDRRLAVSFLAFAGRLIWPERVLEWLTEIGEGDALKVVLGLYSLLAHEEPHELSVKPDFGVSDDLLRRTSVKDDHLVFADGNAKKELGKVMQRSITIA